VEVYLLSPFAFKVWNTGTTLLPSILDPDLMNKIMNLWLLLYVEIS